MALKGVRVVELAGLAPAPFCGMILADFGANVIRVDRLKSKSMMPDTLGRGKKSISVNLKEARGVELLRKMSVAADVLIEPFRAGIMEKMGLGPEILCSANPGLIYARLTGYGQKGPMAKHAGHDINYLATSGILSALGRKGEKPTPPVNLVADFAGGSLTCALGIMMALFERSHSGKGQVVDCSMVEGAAYLASFIWSTKNAQLPLWGRPRGENMLDSGAAYYDTYRTSDSKYMAVGALEPQFYANLVKGLGLDPSEYHQFTNPEELKEKFTEVFSTKTRDEWTKIFDGTDSCVTPVLEMDEATSHPHNVANGTFLSSASGAKEPGPAPSLLRTPSVRRSLPLPAIGQHTREILVELGYQSDDISSMLADGVVEENNTSKL
ncbi:alpha-methylacyl-CoA racemase-like [Liolophura sinensis]|uniref:alpha-methylacyl-CoA racemase-like n=1 Tax=Liolophura sinensis TaxID=3198878 RepID=UPI0031587543